MQRLRATGRDPSSFLSQAAYALMQVGVPTARAVSNGVLQLFVQQQLALYARQFALVALLVTL